MKILRYREDRGVVALVASVFACQMYLYWGMQSPLYTAIAVALILPIQQLGRVCTHYHYHKYVFLSGPLNRIYEVVLFFLTGLSPHLFTLHHTLGHHRLYLDPIEDSLRWKRRDGTRMHLVEILLLNTIGLYRFPIAQRHKYPVVFRRFARMLAFCLALLAALVVVSPVKAAIVFLVPMLILLVDIIRVNLWQHVGVESDNHMTASRNDLSPFYNFVTMNTGYHTAHHVNPSLHWSRLPELHARIQSEIPRELLMNVPDSRSSEPRNA